MTSAIDRSKCRVDSEQECRRLRIRSPVQDIGGFRIQSRIVGDGKEILGGYVHAPARSQGITDLEVFEAKIRRIFHKNARFLAAAVVVEGGAGNGVAGAFAMPGPQDRDAMVEGTAVVIRYLFGIVVFVDAPYALKEQRHTETAITAGYVQTVREFGNRIADERPFVMVDFSIAIQVLESDVARLLWRVRRSK